MRRARRRWLGCPRHLQHCTRLELLGGISQRCRHVLCVVVVTAGIVVVIAVAAIVAVIDIMLVFASLPRSFVTFA